MSPASQKKWLAGVTSNPSIEVDFEDNSNWLHSPWNLHVNEVAGKPKKWLAGVMSNPSIEVDFEDNSNWLQSTWNLHVNEVAGEPKEMARRRDVKPFNRSRF